MLTEPDLTNRSGPLLSDGTLLRDLIDLDKREVSLRLHADAEIHRLELRRIFARSWTGLAHESEIPNPGDFVLRSIGEDPVIVTRHTDGSVHTLLNVCAHRGMEVCWADAGNQAQFKCPYHGWVFDGSGKLLGAPFEQEMYGDWDKAQYGLRAARTEARHGVIFGNFDPEPDAMSLDEYLGDFAVYFDEMYGTHDFEALGPPIHVRVNSNWKTAADQFAGDGYHTLTLHKSIMELGFISLDDVDTIRNVKVAIPDRGHVTFAFNPQERRVDGIQPDADPNLDKLAFKDRSYLCIMFPATHGGGNGFGRITMPDGTFVPTAVLGGLTPRGPDHFEFWQLNLIDRSMPEEVKTIVRKLFMFDAASVFVDDLEAWPAARRAVQGVVAQQETAKYHHIAGENRPPGWPDGGRIYAGYALDDPQWSFWRAWFDTMTRDEASFTPSM